MYYTGKWNLAFVNLARTCLQILIVITLLLFAERQLTICSGGYALVHQFLG